MVLIIIIILKVTFLIEIIVTEYFVIQIYTEIWYYQELKSCYYIIKFISYTLIKLIS